MTSHIFIAGLLLGWGAAIPIGPLNIEIIRRNLCFGISRGMALAFGACSADMIYLSMLALGIFFILDYPLLIRVISFIGGLILAWFGINALRLKSACLQNTILKNKNLLQHYIEGLSLTLLNPYTILFWISVSGQVAALSHSTKHALFHVGSGVVIAVLSWAISLNVILHWIRHKLSEKTMHYLNIIGGVILLGFATYGILHAIFA